MNIGFVICSRVESSRVPNKAFVKYNGKPHIEHLIERLLKTDIPVYVAVPETDAVFYNYLLDKYPKRVFISAGFADDPLRRMFSVAKQNELDAVIRVTHDKIFVDPDMVFNGIDRFHSKGLDYLYSSGFIPGTSFEIISYSALEKASQAFKRVEHVSYAVKAVTDNKLDWFTYEPHLFTQIPGVRLLVDYPEDVEFMHVLLAGIGNHGSLWDALNYVSEHQWLKNINRLPLVTVYTCGYNAEKWIEEAMGSVASQKDFKDYEYILIDDCSSDRTPYLMAKFCQVFKNAKWFRNQKNLGLATSSNIALKQARGKYIVRMDADDYFSSNQSVQLMLDEIEDRQMDVIYPNNWLGESKTVVQKGKEHHHIGGALFRTAAINHVKFTEGLRNFEGLDFFTRAHDQIRVGYLSKPIFVYRQHGESMSKTNLEERELTKKIILGTEDESGKAQISGH